MVRRSDQFQRTKKASSFAFATEFADSVWRIILSQKQIGVNHRMVNPWANTRCVDVKQCTDAQGGHTCACECCAAESDAQLMWSAIGGIDCTPVDCSLKFRGRSHLLCQSHQNSIAKQVSCCSMFFGQLFFSVLHRILVRRFLEAR